MLKYYGCSLTKRVTFLSKYDIDISMWLCWCAGYDKIYPMNYCGFGYTEK